MKLKNTPNPEQPKKQSDFWKNKKVYEKVQYQINNFFGPPLARIVVPQEIVDGLNKTVDRKLNEKYITHGDRLVGQINHEPDLSIQDLDESGAAHFFHSCTASFIHQILSTRFGGVENLKNNFQLSVLYKSAWAVCQYENEYNPVHFHTDCDISSVMYLKIPEYEKRWDDTRPYKQNWVDGRIEFVANSAGTMGLEMGTYQHTPQVGELFLFPSNLLHTVYPFLGKGERRSVAFNMAYQLRDLQKGVIVSGFNDPVGITDDGMGATMIPKHIHDTIQSKKK